MINKIKMWITVGAVALIVVVGLILRPGAPAPITTETQTPAGEVTPPPAPGGTTSGGTKTTQTAPPTQKPSSISVLSPIPGEEWVIGSTNVVRWSKATASTSAIYLLDSQTRNVVGWITSTNSPGQTFFNWDTRYIYQARYSPTKNSVLPGKYIARVKFDLKGQADAESGVFSIITPAQVQEKIYTVAIKNSLFIPSTLNVNKGNKITFVNNDSVQQRVLFSGQSPRVLAPGESFTFDTTSLFPSPYTFYSDIYPSMTLTVTVK